MSQDSETTHSMFDMVDMAGFEYTAVITPDGDELRILPVGGSVYLDREHAAQLRDIIDSFINSMEVGDD